MHSIPSTVCKYVSYGYEYVSYGYKYVSLLPSDEIYPIPPSYLPPVSLPRHPLLRADPSVEANSVEMVLESAKLA